MTLKEWASKQSLQVVARAYLLSLSLSLGPALIPVVTSYVRRSKAKKNTTGALLQLVLNELGVNGFAFAVAVSFGGSIALNEWFSSISKEDDASKAQDTQSSELSLTKFISKLVHKLSPTQRTFIATFLSTSFGASLLRPRSKRHPSRPIHTPGPPTKLAKLPPTLDLTLLLLTRACDVGLQYALRDFGKQDSQALNDDKLIKFKRLRSITSKIDAFLFWLSSARIMWCWFYKPHRLPRSYVKWIATLGNVDQRLMEGLRHLRTGEWSYITGSRQHLDLLQDYAQSLGYKSSWGNPLALPPYGGEYANDTWRRLGVSNRHGLGGLPCELVHGSVGKSLGLEGSCTANWMIRGAVAFVEAAAIYLPVHFAPVILSRPRKLLDMKLFLPTLLGAGQSATFLASFVALYYAAVCFTRTLVLARALPFISHDFWDGPYGCIMAGSLVCGSSIWIENGKRRGEMAFYVLPRAIRTVLPVMWMKANARKTKLIERVALLISFSTILSAALHRPELLRGLLRRTISFILGSAKRKEPGISKISARSSSPSGSPGVRVYSRQEPPACDDSR